MIKAGSQVQDPQNDVMGRETVEEDGKVPLWRKGMVGEGRGGGVSGKLLKKLTCESE